MSQYLEVKHEEAVASVRNKYAMVDRIKVKRAKFKEQRAELESPAGIISEMFPPD